MKLECVSLDHQALFDITNGQKSGPFKFVCFDSFGHRTGPEQGKNWYALILCDSVELRDDGCLILCMVCWCLYLRTVSVSESSRFEYRSAQVFSDGSAILPELEPALTDSELPPGGANVDCVIVLENSRQEAQTECTLSFQIARGRTASTAQVSCYKCMLVSVDLL